jgi:hypothetical protein
MLLLVATGCGHTRGGATLDADTPLCAAAHPPSRFFTLTLPPPWKDESAEPPLLSDARTSDGGRVAAWALSVTPSTAAPGVRRNNLTIELRRASILDVELTEATVGGEPALAGIYVEPGRYMALISVVRDGIEYRISVDGRSEEQRKGVFDALSRDFSFPDATKAERARAALPISRSALDGSLERARQQPVGVRAALTGATSPSNLSCPGAGK